MSPWILLSLWLACSTSALAAEKKAPAVSSAKTDPSKPGAPALPTLQNKAKKPLPKGKRKPASEGEEKEVGKQSFLSNLGIEVQIEGAFHLVNATEKGNKATASLVSEFSPKIGLVIEKDFKFMSAGLEGSIDQRSFAPIPKITTSGLSHSLIFLGLRLGRTWMPGLSTDLIPFFGGQTLFFRVDAVNIKAVPLNAAGGMLLVQYSYNLPFNLSADVKASALVRAPATLKPLTTTLGYGGSAYLGLGLKIKRLQAGLGAGFIYEQRPATLLNFDTTSLLVRATASYTF